VTRWVKGARDVEAFLTARRLQRVRGAQANGEALMVRARTSLASAGLLLDSDPNGAYILAYDAARQACTALLAAQGLRPTNQGGHYIVEEALKAQFGADFRLFGTLRRRRHELEYPQAPDETAERTEAEFAVATAEALVAAAGRLLPQLGLF
jgi:hypothetical protein